MHVSAIGLMANELSEKNTFLEMRPAQAENMLENLLKQKVGADEKSISSCQWFVVSAFRESVITR
jgi:hypothetical protein